MPGKPETTLKMAPVPMTARLVLFRERGDTVFTEGLAQPAGEQGSDGGFADAAGTGEFYERHATATWAGFVSRASR